MSDKNGQTFSSLKMRFVRLCGKLLGKDFALKYFKFRFSLQKL